MFGFMSNAALDRKIKALEALRSGPDSEARVEQLRRALRDRSNYFVSKAAALVGQLGIQELIPDLAAAFDRFMNDPVKSGPQCWAKNAIVKALKDLGYNEASFFLRATRHFQLEPVWGRSEDTAGTLRGAAALALVACPLPRLEILEQLADLLAADPAKTVRSDAALAIAQLSGPDSALLLRFKALAGDKEAEVVGQCLTSLVDMSADYLSFVARFLDSTNPDLPLEAAAALGSSNDPRSVPILIERYRATSDAMLTRSILLSLGASRHAEVAEFLVSIIPQAPFDDAAYAIRALAASRFREEYRARAADAVRERGDPKVAEVFAKEYGRN